MIFNAEMRRLEKKYATLTSQVDNILRPLVEAIDIDEMAKTNAHYLCCKEDKFKHLVEIEKRRYLMALEVITKERSSGTVCDLGCLVPYLPIALSILGFEVKIADRYDFYGDQFKTVIHKIADTHKIAIKEMNILDDPFDNLGKNDVVTLLAVVEHLNGTPKKLIEKIRGIIANNGFFVFDVPNIAEFIKRVRMVFGFSPLGDYSEYFLSKYPHTGHNREMTVDEVKYLFEKTNYKMEYLSCYDYTPEPVRTTKGRIALALKKIIPMKNKGDSIMTKVRPI